MKLRDARKICKEWTESNAKINGNFSGEGPGVHNWGTNEVLIGGLQGWAICRYSDDDGPIYYGEHYHGCRTSFDGAPGWCWEWSDTEATRCDAADLCWSCSSVVPKSVVGIVAMLNWKEIQS
jgi:hypothetical protein